MNLKRRIERIEGKLKPRSLRAVIQGFLARSSPAGTFAPASLNADDPRLQQGVDDNGGAIVSRWWSVWFFEGTREQQEGKSEASRGESTGGAGATLGARRSFQTENLKT